MLFEWNKQTNKQTISLELIKLSNAILKREKAVYIRGAVWLNSGS